MSKRLRNEIDVAIEKVAPGALDALGVDYKPRLTDAMAKIVGKRQGKAYWKGHRTGLAEAECHGDHVEGWWGFFVVVGFLTTVVAGVLALCFAVSLILTAVEDHGEINRLRDQISQQRDDVFEFAIPATHCDGLILAGECQPWDTKHNAPQKATTTP